MGHSTTTKKVGSKAGKLLGNKKTPKDVKSVSGNALGNMKHKGSKKK